MIIYKFCQNWESKHFINDKDNILKNKKLLKKNELEYWNDKVKENLQGLSKALKLISL